MSGVAGDVATLAAHPGTKPGPLFGHTLQNVGQGLIQKSIEGILAQIIKKRGLAAPDGSLKNPFYVVVENWPVGTDALGNEDQPSMKPIHLPGSMDGVKIGPDGMTVANKAAGGIFSSIGGTIGKIVGAIGMAGGLNGKFGGARASGGSVSAGTIYGVNEGQSEFFIPNVNGYVSPTSRAGSGGGIVHYSIDARGTDAALVDQRVRVALKAVHRDAIVTSMNATAERAKRVPARSSTAPMSGAGIVG